MTDDFVQAIWSWLPISLVGAMTACALYRKNERVSFCGFILLFDALGCMAWDRSLVNFYGDNANYGLWASLGYASIDITAAGMLAACFGMIEAVLALLLVISMVENIAFGLTSHWGQIDFTAQMRYGWTTFGISLSQAALLAWWWRDGGSGLYRICGSIVARMARAENVAAYRPYDRNAYPWGGGAPLDDGRGDRQRRGGVQERWPDGPAAFSLDRDHLLAAAAECGLGEAGYSTLISNRNRTGSGSIVLSDTYESRGSEWRQANGDRYAGNSGGKPSNPREAPVTIWGASLLAAFRVPFHREASEAIRQAEAEADKLIAAAEAVKSLRCGCCEEDSFEDAIRKVAGEL